MRKRIFIAVSIIGILFLFAFRYGQKAGNVNLKYISREEALKNKFTVQCTPDWNHLNGDSLAKGMHILNGWGNYQWNITSKSDSARLYFQQGINMYYSFHIIEAMASFKKAEQFDDTNAMICWGQALAYGPNINDFAYSSTPEAFAAAQKAIALSDNCSAREKALIKAMGVRYSADSTISRASLNQLYTGEMQKAYTTFLTDADIAALYADAMMLQHPWEYWKHNGDAQPWTPRILEVLENALKHSPNHPGANHYYIHSVEASTNPQRALPSANRLSKLMPSVSHMVHMPSHIYIRSGLYNEGTKVNEMSLKGYYNYLAVYPDVVNNAPLYLIHNLHMQTACAMMGKGYTYSSKAADDCRASFDTSFMSSTMPFGSFVQYVYMTPVINNVRFGKWEAVLAAPEINENYIYANLLNHWARGIALARTNKIAAAKKELNLLVQNMNKPDMLVVMQPFNAPVAAAKIAQKLLEATIAEQEKDLPHAINLFSEAVQAEDAFIYNEPKDWLIPARQFLGAALLKSAAYSKAATIFKEDLKENPNNHWSLKGLFESLQKQRLFSAAELIKKQLDKIVFADDMKDMPVVF
jgi:tetratricopeptide (TPR) repeat protein